MRRTITSVLAVAVLLSTGACGDDGDGSSTSTSATLPGGAALSESGPYGVGDTIFSAVDATRDDRSLVITAFYPADVGPDDKGRDAAPDTSGAPYPVVVGDLDIGRIVGPHLASYGFVFLAVQGQSTWGYTFSPDMVDYPLDQVLALDAVQAMESGVLAGLADTARSGAVGYSYGSWDALMLAGARVDPDHYADTCATRPANWSDNWWQYVCGNPAAWAAVVARAEELGVAGPDGLWQSLGDERIKAVMPMAPEGYDLVGPAGLAEVTVPALFIAAGNDEGNDYHPATTSLFAHYPGAELITFVGAAHSMIFEDDVQQQVRRFALAFFGLHLIGDEGFDQYLTEEFVEDVAPGLGPAESFETLVWGVST